MIKNYKYNEKWDQEKIYIKQELFNTFQLSVVFHIEKNHLICTANYVSGFYIKRNLGLC